MKGLQLTKLFAVGTISTLSLLASGTGMAYADNVTPTSPHQDSQSVASAPACVDGSDRGNLRYDWSPSGTISVGTKDDAVLCDDVTVYLSDYTLPAGYDDSGIFDDSSIPQQLFDSTSMVLQKGTDGNATLTIKVPDACTDYQLDLYYAPEITTVDGSGHGSQLINGIIYPNTQTGCEAPAPQPGRGGGESTPPPAPSTPTPAPTPAPAPVAAPVKASLADTGTNAVVPAALALVMAMTAILINFPVVRAVKRLAVR